MQCRSSGICFGQTDLGDGDLCPRGCGMDCLAIHSLGAATLPFPSSGHGSSYLAGTTEHVLVSHAWWSMVPMTSTSLPLWLQPWWDPDHDTWVKPWSYTGCLEEKPVLDGCCAADVAAECPRQCRHRLCDRPRAAASCRSRLVLHKLLQGPASLCQQVRRGASKNLYKAAQNRCRRGQPRTN